MSTTAVKEVMSSIETAFDIAKSSMERTMDSVANVTKFEKEVKVMTVDGRDAYVVM